MKLFCLLTTMASQALAAECNGQSTPGPPNLEAVIDEPPVFVRQVANGKLYTVGTGDDIMDVMHVWGTPFEQGQAQGLLNKEKLESFITKVYTYMEDQIIAKAANNTFLAWVAKTGLSVALDASYEQTKDFIKPYVMEELEGKANVTDLDVVDIRNVIPFSSLPSLQPPSCADHCACFHRLFLVVLFVSPVHVACLF